MYSRLAGICLLIAVGVAVSVNGQTGGATNVLTSVEGVRALSSMERLKEHPVALEGLVLARFRDRNRLYVHDAGRGLVVLPSRNMPEVPFGSRVRVEGVTTVNLKSHVQATNVAVLERDAITPTPERVEVPDLLGREPYDGWYEVSGFVLSARHFRNSLQLRVRAGGQVLIVAGPPVAPERLDELVFARVRLRGIWAMAGLRGTPDSGTRVFWIDGPTDLIVLEPWSGDPFSLPLVPASDFAGGNIRASDDQPIRMRLKVVANDAGEPWYRAADESGEVRVGGFGKAVMESGDVIEVLGLGGDGGEESYFLASQVRWLGVRGSDPLEERPLASPEWMPVIDDMGGFRALSPSDWAQKLPVRTFAQVSYRDESGGVFHLQMGGWAGVLARWEADTNGIPPRGSRLLVRGHTVVGREGPMVVVRQARLMRSDTVPEPRSPSVDSFLSGRALGAWMSLEGVVRSVDADDLGTKLRCEWQNEIVTALVNLPRTALPANLVDSVVRLTGVGGTMADVETLGGRRPVLRVATAGDVEIIAAAAGGPFAEAALPMRDVVEGVWAASGRRRVRVRGTVTSLRATHLTVDDGLFAALVLLVKPAKVSPGDEVDVLGFPASAVGGGRLEDAEVRRIGAGRLPDPSVGIGGGRMGVSFNNRRVRLRGVLSGQTAGPRGHTLVLRGDGGAFTVGLPPAVEGEFDRLWENDSVIEVTGVCRMERDADGSLGSLHVLLPGPEAVAVLARPPWWTTGRMLGMAGGTSLLAVVAAAWAVYHRRRAERNRRQFLTTFDAGPLPAWIRSQRTGCLVAVNRQYVALFGYTGEEVVGLSSREFHLWDSDADREKFIQHLEANQRVAAYEARLRARSGQVVQALLAVEPLDVGKESCVLIIAYDVTERLKLLEQLRQSQKMQAVGQLAAGVAHDFNNLLTIIRGNSTLLRTIDSVREIREINEEIDHAASRAADLTRRLLTFSRRQEMQRRALELRQVVDNAAAMVLRVLGKSVDLTIANAGEPLPIWADSGMLDQVILNLAVNARDAMPDGGKLVITTRRGVYTAADVPDFADAVPGEFAVLCVADTGQGMTEEVQRQAFDPFFTTKDVGQGTGLGLATIRGIVSQHHGWIGLDTARGRGTTFSIHLPIVTGEPESEVFETAGSADETILVVDDEAPLRVMIGRALTRQGYTVLEAEDGSAAEALWREHRHHCALLLTDIMMPNGMSGVELAARLREEAPDLKVVYMTGYSDELVEYGGAPTAGLDFLPKPFDREELVKVVRRRLDLKSADEEG